VGPLWPWWPVEAEEAEAGDGVELMVVAMVVVAVVVMVGGPRAAPANGCGWLIAAEDAVQLWEGESGRNLERPGEGRVWR
jgi:hypothetical protein